MLEFDDKTIQRLKNPKTKTGDKLYLFARFIEEKNEIKTQPNYWDSALKLSNAKEDIYYKVWLWMNYVEWETLVAPNSAFAHVFGKDKASLLERYVNKNLDQEDLETFYTLDGKAGTILLKWAMKEWIY